MERVSSEVVIIDIVWVGQRSAGLLTGTQSTRPVHLPYAVFIASVLIVRHPSACSMLLVAPPRPPLRPPAAPAPSAGQDLTSECEPIPDLFLKRMGRPSYQRIK